MSKKLFIKHFPSRMTLDERQQFLHSFGALKVQCFPDNGKMVTKYSCFATFYDEQSATNAMHKLHQLNLFGFRLSVEYANDDKLIANEYDIVCGPSL
ncbi:RNA-binding protein 40-like protein [Leptotrombidium deliense]|uniref:RNA-binding protein 40-like protein n=1 Tax=Leptotrombidium deliense TaxID=299467 RepID=A0A443SQS7_9ACAR|nr:RNA-binding protein 40-like protein [Leptotrombidium deliense]